MTSPNAHTDTPNSMADAVKHAHHDCDDHKTTYVPNRADRRRAARGGRASTAAPRRMRGGKTMKINPYR